MVLILGLMFYNIIMIAMLFVAWKKGLMKFSGNKYRDRLVWSLAGSVFVSSINLVVFRPNGISLVYSIPLGLLLLAVFVCWDKRLLYQRLDGAVLRYETNSYARAVVFVIPIIVSLAVAVPFLSLSQDALYLIKDLLAMMLTSVCIAWFGGTIVAIIRLRNIERDLGVPVIELENRRNKGG